MDQSKTLHCISKLSGVLEVLHKEHSKLQYLHSQVSLGNIPSTVLALYPGKSLDEVSSTTLSDLSDRLRDICTKINRTNDAIDKLDPPPTIYFKKSLKPRKELAANVSFDPHVNFSAKPALQKARRRPRPKNPFNFVPMHVNSIA
jgi:hypothetical protein